MGYFDDEKRVEDYVKMAEGYDGRDLIEVLKQYVPTGAAVLELGMGPGKDLDILNESFQVTGSDNAQTFLDRYRKQNATADLVLLDAVEIDIDRQFDAIYSNKVLQHLTREALQKSLQRQGAILKEGGILFHALWYGDKEEEFSSLRFVYYTEETLRPMIGPEYEVLESKRYTEMAPDDSMYVVLRKK